MEFLPMWQHCPLALNLTAYFHYKVKLAFHSVTSHNSHLFMLLGPKHRTRVRGSWLPNLNRWEVRTDYTRFVGQTSLLLLLFPDLFRSTHTFSDTNRTLNSWLLSTSAHHTQFTLYLTVLRCPDLTRTHLLTELLAQISNLQLLQLQST